MCRELFKLARRGGSITGRPVAGTKFQQWYFFYTAAFWLYLRHAMTCDIKRSTVRWAAPTCVHRMLATVRDRHLRGQHPGMDMVTRDVLDVDSNGARNHLQSQSFVIRTQVKFCFRVCWLASTSRHGYDKRLIASWAALEWRV